MLKYIRALSVAGLATLSSSQLATAGDLSVLWSPDKDNSDLIMAGVSEAAQAISRVENHHPTIRFTSHGAGGTALVPLWPFKTGGRCSPNFDLAPFRAEKGQEVWAHFAFVNIQPADRELIALAIKADKPGCKDRYRADHDIGCGKVGNKPAMTAMLGAPAEGDYAYYFADKGILNAVDILERNPSAAIRITISNHLPGREV